MNGLESLGALAGALVGDAAGATLEFYHREITDKKARKAMCMLGGGSLDVGPGQITDDGELTLALASALWGGPVWGDPLAEPPWDRVAEAYAAWHKSNPFDMGHTTWRAFAFASTAADMRANALKYNTSSEANGQLMRCTPIPAFFHSRPYPEIAEIARSDALLSHPSEACQDCAALYSVAIAYLINHPGDADGAIQRSENFPGIGSKVRGWLEDSRRWSESGTPGNCRINVGHVMHAFTLAFYFLRKKTGYEDAIRETLKLGGDTDTNACIVGGMIGVLHGFSAIPAYMAGPVFKFDPVAVDVVNALVGHQRPAKYRASNIFTLTNTP